ncbi:leucine-rich repeat domain-containing protein [Flavobacterium sp.]|uniref:DUF7619 domain-containing protein n=1 Tax=Flavobacterium sp. TaxID=239 RepID=UPI00286A6687|nr:leucine-rich repeat domain-containing protein [Flavobacterium sp.]
MKNIFLLLLLFTGMVKAQIVTIPDANFKTKLIALGVDTNADGDIQQTEASSVTILNVSSSNISDLTGISAFTNLQNLTCDNNQLTSLNLDGLSNLQTLQCYNNQLTDIDVSGLSSLQSLYLGFNQLTSINVSNLTNLKSLDCQSNQVSSIDMTGITDLYILRCQNNQLTTLDLSGNTRSNLFVDCSNNNLSTLFMKNGWNVTLEGLEPYCQCSRNIYFFNNPNLTYVCCDVGEIAAIQALSGTTDYATFTANSYCSFTPGGNFNTITGNIKYDADNNGCDAADINPANIRININDTTQTGASFSSASGQYTFFTLAGNFTITPSVENPTWFNFSPTIATIPFADNNNNTATQDFCIAANGSHQDLEVVIAPVTPGRPGFDAVYKIVYRNKGNTILNAEPAGLIMYYDIDKMDYVASSQPVTNQGSNSINFGYTIFFPFESRSLLVTMHMHSPTDANPVNIGDVLNFAAGISPNNLDENMDDNYFVYHQTVVGSFDPNSIECLEGAVVPPSEIGNYLHYAINFENTGTFPAENIVVKTEVDASKFDINSLQLMNTNFPVDARISGNKVEFIFKNINLDIGGHGHILLKIKTNNTLVTGDAVANRADIFFDYNAPIDTGLANTVFQTLSNTDFEIDNSVVVSPNPASNEVTIKADNNIKSIQLYDVQGRVISTCIVNELESKLNISRHSKGIYFIKIITEKGIKVQKLLKD